MKVRQSYCYGATRLTVRYLYDRKQNMVGAQEINEAEILQHDEVKMPPVQLTDESFVSLLGILRTRR